MENILKSLDNNTFMQSGVGGEGQKQTVFLQLNVVRRQGLSTRAHEMEESFFITTENG